MPAVDYVEACRRIIEQVDDAERQVSGEYRAPKGDLVVTTPWGLGHTHLLPIAVEFLDAYPEIGVRLLLTDRIVDTAEENIDLAVRIGSLPESSMIATKIGSIRLVVCASPAYLAERGRPQTPDQLAITTASQLTMSARPPPGNSVAENAQAWCRYSRVSASTRPRLLSSPRSPAPGSPGSCPTRWMRPGARVALELVLEDVRAGAVADTHRLFAAKTGTAETPAHS